MEPENTPVITLIVEEKGILPVHDAKESEPKKKNVPIVTAPENAVTVTAPNSV